MMTASPRRPSAIVASRPAKGGFPRVACTDEDFGNDPFETAGGRAGAEIGPVGAVPRSRPIAFANSGTVLIGRQAVSPLGHTRVFAGTLPALMASMTRSVVAGPLLFPGSTSRYQSDILPPELDSHVCGK